MPAEKDELVQPESRSLAFAPTWGGATLGITYKLQERSICMGGKRRNSSILSSGSSISLMNIVCSLYCINEPGFLDPERRKGAKIIRYQWANTDLFEEGVEEVYHPRGWLPDRAGCEHCLWLLNPQG